MENPESKVGNAFEYYLNTYGVEALGHMLAKSLTAVTAQFLGGYAESGTRIWEVENGYVSGRVSVCFSPGTEENI